MIYQGDTKKIIRDSNGKELLVFLGNNSSHNAIRSHSAYLYGDNEATTWCSASGIGAGSNALQYAVAYNEYTDYSITPNTDCIDSLQALSGGLGFKLKADAATRVVTMLYRSYIAYNGGGPGAYFSCSLAQTLMNSTAVSSSSPLGFIQSESSLITSTSYSLYEFTLQLTISSWDSSYQSYLVPCLTMTALKEKQALVAFRFSSGQ